MARRQRRDEDGVDERLDQETDEARDGAADDPSDLDATESPGARPARRRAGTAVRRGADSEAGSGAKTRKGRSDRPARPERERVGLFGRLSRFIREVFGELRKVIWPNRKELMTYTVVVVVFVAAMVAIIGLLDVGFARVMLWVFGSNTVEE